MPTPSILGVRVSGIAAGLKDNGKHDLFVAELVPGSTFLLVADMGHDLPEPLLPLITGAMAAHMKLAEWQRATGH